MSRYIWRQHAHKYGISDLSTGQGPELDSQVPPDVTVLDVKDGGDVQSSEESADAVPYSSD